MSRVILGPGETEDDMTHVTRPVRNFQRDERRTQIGHGSTNAGRVRDAKN
jgi:hypothetical protein